MVQGVAQVKHGASGSFCGGKGLNFGALEVEEVALEDDLPFGVWGERFD